MTFKDSAASASWAGFRSSAVGVVAAVAVANMTPGDGDRSPSVGVPLTMAVDNNGGTNTDVQVQVATDAAMTTVVASVTLTNQPNGVSSWQPTGLSAGVTYYWRARGAPTGTTSWGAWSGLLPWSFVIDTNSGRGFAYSYENVGAQAVLYSGDIEHTYENVGFQIVLFSGVIEYQFENVGFPIILKSSVAEYVYEGDVSTHTPTPMIWWLEPPAGRPNDGVKIVGFGFGDLPATYGGVVEVFYGGSRGWAAVPVVTWQTFPASPDAYGPLRTIDEIAGKLDPQHQIIEITVPADALPPGYPIRVRTEGP